LAVNREHTARSLTVFTALVLFGVLGRLLQPDWNIAPVAAVGGFAAYYFGSMTIAMLTAVAVMAISNFWLPAYDSPGMMVAVLAAYVVPVLLGRWLHTRFSLAKFGVLCIASPVAFFLATNFAHWALTKQYAPTWAGLIECYAAALPFFRYGTLPGDLCYFAAVFGTYAIAKRWSELRQLRVCELPRE
jgi:hypothetical protein